MGRPFTIIGTSSFCNHDTFRGVTSFLHRSDSSCTVINFELIGALARGNCISHNVYRVSGKVLASIARHAGVVSYHFARSSNRA